MRARFAGLAVGLLLGAGLTACADGFGAGEDSWISAPEVFYLRPYGDESGPENKVSFHLRAEDGAVPDRTGPADHRLTMDLEGAGGAVRLWVKTGHGCHGTDTRVVCRVGGLYDSWVESDRVYPVATKKGRPGDSARIRFSFTTKAGKKVTARTRVVVGEPVLKLRSVRAGAEVRPGAQIGTSVVVRNTGEVPVRGLGLQLHAGESEFRQRYANCRYPEQMHGRQAVCAFPGLRIAPGETVAVRPEVPLRAGKVRIFSEVSQEVWPLDVGPAKYSAVPDNGDRGDGPALTAKTLPDGGGGTFVQGIVRTPVTLDLHADFRVTANTLRVGKGREVHLKVADDGPGNPGGSGQLRFTPPPGAVVREQPMEEIDDDVYEPACDLDDGTYVCQVYEVDPGAERTFDFTLDVPEPGSGRVEFTMASLETGGRDPDLSDNSAKVIVLP